LRFRLERLIGTSGLAIDEAILSSLEFMSFERAVAKGRTLKLITYYQVRLNFS
jgi:hypothetical protein